MAALRQHQIVSLDLYSNQLDDLRGIEGLTSLRVLHVGMNHLTGLQPLSALTALEVRHVTRHPAQRWGVGHHL